MLFNMKTIIVLIFAALLLNSCITPKKSVEVKLSPDSVKRKIDSLPDMRIKLYIRIGRTDIKIRTDKTIVSDMDKIIKLLTE